tara:strand:- start:1394 stop:1663 length:270 start_codon:yes stop_codon:yes gene_type:complete
MYIFLVGLSILFLGGVALSAFKYKEAKRKKKFPHLYIAYSLLFITWVANTAAYAVGGDSLITIIILYTVSTLFFLFILYRVIKKINKGH